MTALITRLRAVEGRDGPGSTHWYRNPDGPEAAAEIERQAARIAELEAALTWRPIETAPNEESILILYDDGSVRLIEAEENDLEWRPWQGARGPGVSLPMLWMDATGITSAAVAAIAALNPGDPK